MKAKNTISKGLSLRASKKISKWQLGLLVFIAVCAGVYGIVLSHAASTDTANLWIIPSGGSSSCQRSATPVDFGSAPASAKCNSMQAADAAASNNDTVRFIAGNYAAQSLAATSKTVTYIGAGDTTLLASLSLGGTSGGVLQNKVDNKTIQSIKSSSGGDFIGANNVTVSNSTLIGITYIESTSNLKLDTVDFDGSAFATSDVIDIYEQDRAYQANDHITITNSKIHGARAETSASHPDGIQFCNCSGARGDSFHATNVVVSNNSFYDNECINLRTNPGTGLMLENNVFDDSVTGISGCGYYTADVIGANGTMRYNTFKGGQQIQANASWNATQTWIGNVGVGHSSDCGVLHGTWSHNIWTSQKCSASDLQIPNLVLNSEGKPEADSPAIDYGDKTNYPTTDKIGNPRPSGNPPNAGAFEAIAAPPTANLWVIPSGGLDPCTRPSSPVDYSSAPNSAKCSSMQAAVKASHPGDLIRMKAGSYGGQTITSNSSLPGVLILAEDGTNLSGSLTTQGDWVTVQNVHAAGGGFSDVGGGHPTNVTWNNVDISGGVVFIDGGTNFTWKGGALHDNSVNNEGHLVLQGIPPSCASGASQCTSDLTNTVIDGIKFYNLTRNQACIQSSCHNEVIRIDNGANGVTIKNSTFGSGNDPNTALVFTGDKGFGADEKNITIEQNFWGNDGVSFYGLDVSKCVGLKVNYNTFSISHAHLGCETNTPVSFVGNTGSHPAGCATGSATVNWVKNVWSDGHCGGNDYNGNTNINYAADGFHIAAGSDTIDYPGYCLTFDMDNKCIDPPTYCPPTDIDGDPRPQGAICDAGADEFVASGGGGGGTNSTPGDVNGDKKVGVLDLSVMLSNFGKTSADWTEPRCDTNGDGKVTILDLSVVLSKYGTTYP